MTGLLKFCRESSQMHNIITDKVKTAPKVYVFKDIKIWSFAQWGRFGGLLPFLAVNSVFVQAISKKDQAELGQFFDYYKDKSI